MGMRRAVVLIAGLTFVFAQAASGDILGARGDIDRTTTYYYTYYVSTQGSDTNTGYTPQQAFATIQKGIDTAYQAASSHAERIKALVIVGPGLFQTTSPVVVRQFVDLRGAGFSTTDPSRQTIIRTSSRTGVVMQRDSTINGFIIELAASLSGQGPAVLVAASDFDEFPVLIWRCLLDGSRNPNAGGPGSYGVDVAGGDAYTVAVVQCIIRGLTTGLRASHSGVNATRCRFEDIAGPAVLVQSASKQSGTTVPILGLADFLELTGLNQFRNIGGFSVQNSTGTRVRAQMNDWGLEDANLIAQRVSGSVETRPFISKSIGPGTLVARVVNQNNVVVPATANPACTIPALSLSGVRDSESGTFIFTSVPEAQWQVEATATGYPSNSATVQVSSEHVNPVVIQLAGGGPPVCGGSGGKPAYAGCVLGIWAAARCRRRLSHSRR